MCPVTTHHLTAVLGEPVAQIINGEPVLSSGQPLTGGQRRRIRRLLAHGVPEQIDTSAIDLESSSRITQIIREEDQVFLLASAMPAIVDELAAIRSGAPEPASYSAAKSNLALFTAAAAIRAAAEAIKAQDPLPADYLALVAAFDAALA